MKPNFVKYAIVFLGTAGLLNAGIPATAARLDVTPSISLDQVYDSNVFNTNGDEKGDFLLRTTPAVTFSLRMPETTLNLRSSLTSDTYYKYTSLNSNSSAVSLGIDATPISLTPRFAIAPSGHFVQSRDSFRRSQLVPSTDPLLPTSIASETAKHKTRDFGGALRATYIVTPQIDFSLGGGFSKLQFLDNVTGDVDSRVITGDSTLTYRFTPRLSSGIFLNTTYNTFENGRDSRIYSGGLTGTYIFTPALTITARAGVSQAKETDPVAGVPDRTTTSPSILLSMLYVERDLRASITGSIDEAGGGSFGLTTRRHAIGVSVTDRFATEWTGDLSANIQQNRSLDAALSEDMISAAGTAGIAFRPVTWATFRLSGTAFHQWSSGSVGSDLKRYSAFLGITLGYTYNIY